MLNLSHGDNNTLIVKTEQEKTILKWKDFSIKKRETARFIQPSEASATLNRVLGGNPSEILGMLQSNGHLYLINPNGILVGEGACINTTSFIGSTFDVLDSDFLNGENIAFTGNSMSSIINYGKIHTKDGDALLIARHVENHGVLEAEGGRTAAIGCSSLLYKPNDTSPFYVQGGSANDLNTEGNAYSHAIKTTANPDALTVSKEGETIYLTLAKNSGTMRSHRGDRGGEVFLLGDRVEMEDDFLIDVSGKLGGGTANVGGSFQGKDRNLLASQLTRVAKGGTIEASALESGDGGEVIVWSDKVTEYFGHINAKGGDLKGNGGFIEISTPTSGLYYRGTIDTTAPYGAMGNLLLDPNDIVIGLLATSGGFINPYTGVGFATAQLLDTDLTGALTLDADNDINIIPGATISITGTGGGLTFDAGRDLNVNANIAHNAASGGLFNVYSVL